MHQRFETIIRWLFKGQLTFRMGHQMGREEGHREGLREGYSQAFEELLQRKQLPTTDPILRTPPRLVPPFLTDHGEEISPEELIRRKASEMLTTIVQRSHPGEYSREFLQQHPQFLPRIEQKKKEEEEQP